MILKKTFKWFTAVILKGKNWRHGIGSTAVGVWHCLNVEEAKAGLVVANLVKQWWLEERRLLLVCQLVKMAAVCQSGRSSSQTEERVEELCRHQCEGK